LNQPKYSNRLPQTAYFVVMLYNTTAPQLYLAGLYCFNFNLSIETIFNVIIAYLPMVRKRNEVCLSSFSGRITALPALLSFSITLIFLSAGFAGASGCFGAGGGRGVVSAFVFSF